jgi:hypothetical protein
MSKRGRDETEKDSKASAWVKQFSKTYNRDYWFNSETGAKSWTEPESEVKQDSSTKLKECEISKEEVVTKQVKIKPGVKVAIIVPFRDLTAERTRTKQLNRFGPALTAYLKSTDVDFRIFIIEQSDDKRKFNRGKLLNIGYRLAQQDGCNIFIFHDVDLLPSEELKVHYTTIPTENPIHIASVWDRYNANPSYFGGVVSFSKEQFEKVNGFPNNFWGAC